jgi:nitrogenase subunit NifH
MALGLRVTIALSKAAAASTILGSPERMDCVHHAHPKKKSYLDMYKKRQSTKHYFHISNNLIKNDKGNKNKIINNQTKRILS